MGVIEMAERAIAIVIPTERARRKHPFIARIIRRKRAMKEFSLDRS
jgi:hypothetical protein